MNFCVPMNGYLYGFGICDFSSWYIFTLWSISCSMIIEAMQLFYLIIEGIHIPDLVTDHQEYDVYSQMENSTL